MTRRAVAAMFPLVRALLADRGRCSESCLGTSVGRPLESWPGQGRIFPYVLVKVCARTPERTCAIRLVPFPEAPLFVLSPSSHVCPPSGGGPALLQHRERSPVRLCSRRSRESGPCPGNAKSRQASICRRRASRLKGFGARPLSPVRGQGESGIPVGRVAAPGDDAPRQWRGFSSCLCTLFQFAARPCWPVRRYRCQLLG